MKGLKRGLTLAAAILMLAQGFGGFTEVSAKGADLDDTVSANEGEELVHVELPAFPEEDGSVFDFIMDPQGLIEATNAAKYGGESFEAGGTLYFKNTEGAYAYSSESDRLTVTNKSAVPVEITVTAKLDHCEGLDMAEDEEFSDGNAELFLALMDDRGSVTPLNGSGEISVTSRLAAASGQEAEIYSFGLTGACNPDGDWENVQIRPVVTVTWKVTPLPLEEKGAALEETRATETVADETTTVKPEEANTGAESTAAPEETKPISGPEEAGGQKEPETESTPDQAVSSNKLEKE